MNNHAISIKRHALLTLYQYSDGKLPICPLQIANNMGIRVIEKNDAMELIEILGLQNDPEIKKSYAYNLKIGDEIFIIIDRSKFNENGRKMFIAHEIAHIVFDFDNDSFFDNTDIFQRTIGEMACDLFAVHLLSPEILIKSLDCTTTKQILDTFQITPDQAYVMFERVKRNAHFAIPLHEEKLICKKFMPYIFKSKLSRRRKLNIFKPPAPNKSLSPRSM